jgi:hypothetical protein
MENSFAKINNVWQNYQTALNDLPRLSQIKAFRDQVICDLDFSYSLEDNLHQILASEYPMLGLCDVFLFLPSKLNKDITGDLSPTLEARILRDALNLDISFRHLQRQLQPSHAGWKIWRDLQISRYSREDISTRSSQITHIPYAIELSEGCSGGCSFCGVSAQALLNSGLPFKDGKEIYQALLEVLGNACGLLSQYGVLYWATDPLDQPDYECYANLFYQKFGLWPITTTALAENHIERIRGMLRTPAAKRPWGLRCSMRSRYAYQKLFKELTPLERGVIRFLPQYPESSSQHALAGRSFSKDTASQQTQSGGTIACMSGFLISLPKREIQLLTPCLAEPRNLNGYRVLGRDSFTSTDDLPNAFNKLLDLLPCPPIQLNTLLMITIDASQFYLYNSRNFPGLLERLNDSPASLSQLTSEKMLSSSYASLFSHCLELLQYGVLKAV